MDVSAMGILMMSHRCMSFSSKELDPSSLIGVTITHFGDQSTIEYVIIH